MLLNVEFSSMLMTDLEEMDVDNSSSSAMGMNTVSRDITDFNFRILTGANEEENNNLLELNYKEQISRAVRDLSSTKLLSIEILFRYVVQLEWNFSKVVKHLGETYSHIRQLHIEDLKRKRVRT